MGAVLIWVGLTVIALLAVVAGVLLWLGPRDEESLDDRGGGRR